MNDDLLTNQIFVADQSNNVSTLNQFTKAETGWTGFHYFKTSDGRICSQLDERRFQVIETGEILTVADSRGQPR